MQVQLSELILVVAFVRRLILLSLCFVYLPVQALEAPAARHLLTRTGFEPRLVEIEDLQNSSHAESIEKLLHGLRKQPTVEPPAWVHAPPPNVRAMRKAPGNEKEAFRKRQRALGWELKSWWLREMIATPSPLTERMALFWHNHFASSLRKLKIPHPLYRQNELFRKHGTQNAADLLRALIRDPAVLVYLDNHRNVKRAPNENFARELLELFTLGEGHYQESDIKAAARAMSGYGIDKVSGKFKFRAKRHDNGVKVLFGQSGNFDGEAVVEILLAHPRTAEFWSEKLWFEFTGSVAPRQRVRALAQTLRSNNYAVAPWLRSLFLMPEFSDPALYGTRIKSPTEFVVGLARSFNLQLPPGPALARATRRLGQDLFDPPNVRGWPGGHSWISADSLLARQQLIGRLTRGKEMPMMAMAKSKRGRTRGASATVLQRWLAGLPPRLSSRAQITSLLLPLAPVEAQVSTASPTVRFVESLLLDPVYQLN